MASWRDKGYVSDSQDEDEDEDFGALFYARGGEARQGLEEPVRTSTSAVPSETLRQPVEETNEDASQKGQSWHGDDLVAPTKNDPMQDSMKQSPAHPVASPLSTASCLTTAEKLGRKLDEGLSIIQDVLSRSPSPWRTVLQEDDSPLSTPPDSPRIAPSAAQPSTEDVTSVFDQVVTTYAPQRTFRQRTALQQAPYSLEQARYLRYCAERGIKPVHMPRAVSFAHDRTADETQNSQFEEDSQNQDSADQDMMGVDEPRGNSSNHTDLSSSQIINDESNGTIVELPDLETLLSKRDDLHKKTNEPTKRISRLNRTTIDDARIYDIGSNESSAQATRTMKMPRSLRTQQESFPSPPRSMSVDSVELVPLSPKSTNQYSPDEMLTPIGSSALRPRKRPVIEDDSQSGPDHHTSHVLSSSSESEELEREQASPENVRFMQKRVKGVLPASWWSIDRAQKEMNDKRKKDANVAIARPRQEAGVAQRRVVPASNRQPYNTIISDLHDDLVSDEDESREQRTEEHHLSHIDELEEPEVNTSNQTRDSEAIEIADEDGIDPMLPTRRQADMPRRKQLAHSRGYISERQRSRLHAGGRGQAQSGDTIARLSNGVKRRRKREQPGDPVHALDAPDLRFAGRSPKSSFLRVAARQARRGARTHSTSASKKFFQLDKEEDTAEVIRDFQLWNQVGRLESRMVSKPQNVRHDRLPFKHSSKHNGNKRKSAGGSTGAIGALSTPSALRRSMTGAAQIQSCDASPDGETNAGTRTVTCGQVQRNPLHLTHLRAVLPVNNRSGHGQLALKPSEPRSAQLEVLRPKYRGLSRPALEVSTIQPARTMVSSPTPVQMHLADPQAGGARVSNPRTGRRTKQGPVHRPRLHQTLLAPSSPSTPALESLINQTGFHVRAQLEKEFAEHQAAWFQGSRSGITVANQRTQLHFDVFLDVLRSYLPVALQDSESSKEARELRSFLHRLIPNRGQIGAQGQVGDKTLEVLEYDVLVARNVFDLHVCLLNLAPGCAPRPRVLEMKVDFSNAHHEICLVAMSAWKEIHKSRHTDPSIVDGLSNWLHSILAQLVTRWQFAESGARREAMNSTRRIDEQIIRRAIEVNRDQACRLLVEALDTLNQSVKDGTTYAEAQTVFDPSRYFDLLHDLAKLPEMDAQVLRAMMQISSTVVEQQSLRRQNHNLAPIPFLTGLRQAITSATSTRPACSSDLLYCFSRTYFCAARVAVNQGQRSWDDFFEPRSSYSPDMFVPEIYRDSMKSFLYHLLLEHDPAYYGLELRTTVLPHWLCLLLQPKYDEPCNSLLTASIFKHEKDSLVIPDLACVFQPPQSDLFEANIKQSLSEVRHAAVTHIIRYLHNQENNSEAEWLVGGLDESDAVRLLKTMFTTLKEVWMSLSEQPDEQDLYAILVHTALDHYETYPRTDFVVETWFFNPAMFPQRQKHTLAELFTSNCELSINYWHDAEALLRHEISHAQKHGRLHTVADELKDIFLPTILDVITSNTDHIATVALHAVCIEKLIVPSLESRDTDPDVCFMLLDVLIHLYDNLECRLNPFDAADMRPLARAVVFIVPAISRALSIYTPSMRQLAYKLIRLAFFWMINVLEQLPQNIMEDVETICDTAAQEETDEALLLLELVVRQC